jgi:hypothetical protein
VSKRWSFIKFEAFMVTEFNKIFLGTQPCKLAAGTNRRFRNYLCPHHQGCNVTRYPERSLYKRHICLGQPDKSAVAKHSIKVGHINITKLEKVTGYMDCLVKEATEIRLHPNNFNRDGGCNMSRAWQPVKNMLKQSGEPISKQGQAMQALDSAHKLLLARVQPWVLCQGSYTVTSQP